MELVLGALPRAGDALPVEVVERKGLGHPDSMCDALAEQVSLSLARYYRDRFGLVLHHNVDKVLLVGGSAEPAFGGGRVTTAIEVFIAGRATRSFGGVAVPVDELAEAACRDWLRAHVPMLELDRHVRLHILVRPGSRELVELFLRQRETGTWFANDTSIGAGFAPLSDLERAVLAVEQLLNDDGTKAVHPAIGTDVKVLGVRHLHQIELTVAAAIVGRHVANLAGYRDAVAAVAALAREAARREASHELTIAVNAADDPERGEIYLTVTGTSAEGGDDGEAGRGNRANGLITPYRPMTLESVAGKNPVTHVGKLYNLAAALLADDLVREIDAVAAAACVMVSRIGTRVDDPPLVEVQIATVDGRPPEDVRAAVTAVVHEQLRRVPTLVDQLLDGSLAFDRWPLRAPRPA